jgi:hypothetical protein
MIKFSGKQRDGQLRDVCEKYKHSDHKILIFEWWEWKGKHTVVPAIWSDVTIDVDVVINLIKKYDICFFYIREVINDCPAIDKPLFAEEMKRLFNELVKLNVFYITLADDTCFPTNPSKTFNVPWFIPNGPNIYIPESTHIDFDYRQKDFTFNMLLGQDKKERTRIFEMCGNEPYIYSTYFGSKKFKPMSSTHLEDEDILAYFSNKNPESDRLHTMQQVQRRTGPICISHLVPKGIYNNSHFDIVTETQTQIETLNFTTEKTGKPIATGRFFIWYNSPNKVEYLRHFGFELQDYLSDYDSITDKWCRLEAIAELIKEIGDNKNYIKKIYEDTKEARMYNQEVFKKLSSTFRSNLNYWIDEQINRSINAEKTNA